MSMKQKLLLLMGGMMLTAFSLPLAAQSLAGRMIARNRIPCGIPNTKKEQNTH